MSVKQHDIFSVEYLENLEDKLLIPYPLVDEDRKKFTDRAAKVYKDWFDEFSTEEDIMTRESATLFIRAVTNEYVSSLDSRIETMFKFQNLAKDDKLKREEFYNFYWGPSSGEAKSVNTCYENIQHDFIRIDLQKMMDVYVDCMFPQS